MAKKKTGSRRTGGSSIGRFLALPDAEKGRVVAQFDAEFVADTARPLTPSERRLWDRAKAKRLRKKSPSDPAVVGIRIDRTLLKRADALARARSVGRSELIAAALESEIAAAGNVNASAAWAGRRVEPRRNTRTRKAG